MVTDSDSGLTWRAGLSIGLDYSFAKNSRIGLEAGYRHVADTASLRNPTKTIDFDAPPHLQNASAGIWRVGMSYRQSF